MDNDTPQSSQVAECFTALQEHIAERIIAFEPEASFHIDAWQRPEGGGGETRVLTDGAVFERAGVNFSRVTGAQLPAAASARRPELAGRAFEAIGVSVVAHPRNPYAPTAHANVRFFIAHDGVGAPVWWFGGGFDLTPIYAFDADVLAWHRAAEKTCAAFDANLYPRFKQWCDDYFHIPHRDEARGVGGLFFDDFNELDFATSLAFAEAIGHTFIAAYAPIVARRRVYAYGERERQFQLLRRGRYVEFNLVYDRGTLFGLQSKGRTESILMSMPPLAAWQYSRSFDADTPEAQLSRHYLHARDWLGRHAPRAQP